jgi:hypothetical protein
LRAPTVPENEVSRPKFNFVETFDHEPFTELSEVYKTQNGKLVKVRRGKQVTENEIRNEGRANLEWLKKNDLISNSPPETWIGALLQDKKKAADPRHVVTIADWTSYSNMKAMQYIQESSSYLTNFHAKIM